MREGVCPRPKVCHQAAGVSTVQREAIHGSVPHNVAAHAEIVLADNPRQRISEGDQILVQRTERVAPAVCEGRKSTTKIDGRMAERGKCKWPYDRAVGINVALRSEEHTSELQSQFHLVCRLLLEKKKKKYKQ